MYTTILPYPHAHSMLSTAAAQYLSAIAASDYPHAYAASDYFYAARPSSSTNPRSLSPFNTAAATGIFSSTLPSAFDHQWQLPAAGAGAALAAAFAVVQYYVVHGHAGQGHWHLASLLRRPLVRPFLAFLVHERQHGTATQPGQIDRLIDTTRIAGVSFVPYPTLLHVRIDLLHQHHVPAALADRLAAVEAGGEVECVDLLAAYGELAGVGDAKWRGGWLGLGVRVVCVVVGGVVECVGYEDVGNRRASCRCYHADPT